MNNEIQPSRFDYVKYDDESQAKQARMKATAQNVEAAIRNLMAAIDAYDDQILLDFRDDQSPEIERARDKLFDILGDNGDQSLIDLEKSYMWVGKRIRDEQIQRNGSAELQEERTNS